MSKIKVDVYGGEAFPVYDISSVGEYARDIIEIDEETFDRWEEAFNNFSAVQEEIVSELEKQEHADRILYGGIWNGFSAKKELDK